MNHAPSITSWFPAFAGMTGKRETTKPPTFLMAVLLNILTAMLIINASAAYGAPKPALTLFAAASMTDAMDALGEAFEDRHAFKISPVYAASSALARQIEYGAPADFFISASVAWMDYLEERNLIEPQSRFNLVSNQLILVTAGICDPALDLHNKASILSGLKGRRLSLGEPSSVPAGIYAAQALTSLGLYDALAPQMVFAENVRMALTWVTRRAVDFGIVYASDLHAVTGVNRCATFPEASHDPILYPIAHINNGKKDPNAAAAQAFLAFLTSAEASEIFNKFGFDTPPESTAQSTPALP